MLDTQGNMVFTRPAKPDDDPVPWLTDLWRESGCFAADLPTAFESLAKRVGMAGAAREAFSPEAQALSAVLGSAKTAIAALHADSAVYQVAFGDKGVIAGTDTLAKSVVIGTTALTVPWLTEGQRAAVVVGLSFHETGHINDSQPFRRRVEVAWFGSPKLRLALKLHNVGDDNRIERLQVGRFPSLKAALDCAAWFATKLQTEAWAEQGLKDPFPADLRTAKGREKVLCMAARYPFTVDWSTVKDAEREFMLGWARKMAADHSVDQHVDWISEAIDWINTLPEAEEEQPTEGGDEGEPQPTEGGEKGEPKEGKPGDAEGDDEDGDGASDKSDEDGDEKSDSKPADDGEAGEGEDEESDDSGTKGDDGDDDTEGDDKGGSETDAEGDDDMDGDAEGDDDGESNDSGDQDGDGDAEGDTDSESDADGKPSDPDDKGATPSEEGDADDLMPDTGDDCSAEPTKDKTNDAIADSVTQEHERSRHALKRMRRYPGATGGTVIVRERRLVKWGDQFAMGDEVTESDLKARQIVLNGETPNYVDPTVASWKSRENPNAASALAEVITSARRGPGAKETGQRSGRIDRGRLARVASGDNKVFIRNTAPAPQRVRVHILLDGSSSMYANALSADGRTYLKGESRMSQTCQVARNLAGALDRLPWATARMYAHTEDVQGPFVVPVWQTGEKREKVNTYLEIPASGTPDGYAIAFVCDDLLESLRPSEKGLLIVISDGGPSYQAGVQHVANVVGYYRQRGIRVVSVSIASALSAEKQHKMYGKADVVTFDANTSVFARNVAKVIGSSI